jgi:hypothetical protein
VLRLGIEVLRLGIEEKRENFMEGSPSHRYLINY